MLQSASRGHAGQLLKPVAKQRDEVNSRGATDVGQSDVAYVLRASVSTRH